MLLAVIRPVSPLHTSTHLFSILVRITFGKVEERYIPFATRLSVEERDRGLEQGEEGRPLRMTGALAGERITGTSRPRLGDLGGTGGWILDDHASRDDHQRTLVWLDSSLEWARAKDRTGLVKLLSLVRTEVLFDVDPSEGAPSARATVDGSACRANRGM